MHDAIDIPAPQGTAVVAAADGEIVKLLQSERGGTTIYVLSTDKKLVYYYAHLERCADGLVVGKLVHQGEVIAYVGDAGDVPDLVISTFTSLSRSLPIPSATGKAPTSTRIRCWPSKSGADGRGRRHEERS